MLDLNRPERRALLLGTTLVLLGGAVRVGLGPGPATFSREDVDGGAVRSARSDSSGRGPGTASGWGSALPDLRSAVDSNLSRTRRASTPLHPGEKIDLDRAPAWELERLPGVGPATARLIVRERERSGGFARPEDLGRVKGIGPRRLRRILPYVIAHSRPYYDRSPAPETGPPEAPLPEVSRNGAADPDAPRLDLNTATAGELETLPGIGPSIARRILDLREREGPFRDVEQLRRIPGIGPARFDLIRVRVRVR